MHRRTSLVVPEAAAPPGYTKSLTTDASTGCERHHGCSRPSSRVRLGTLALTKTGCPLSHEASPWLSCQSHTPCSLSSLKKWYHSRRSLQLGPEETCVGNRFGESTHVCTHLCSDERRHQSWTMDPRSRPLNGPLPHIARHQGLSRTLYQDPGP